MRQKRHRPSVAFWHSEEAAESSDAKQLGSTEQTPGDKVLQKRKRKILVICRMAVLNFSIEDRSSHIYEKDKSI